MASGIAVPDAAALHFGGPLGPALHLTVIPPLPKADTASDTECWVSDAVLV